MKKLIVMCGLPGSGKSTYARHLAEESERCEIVSSDAIRAELYGDETIQGDPVEVFSVAHQRIIEKLNEIGCVIFDATNILSKHRVALLKLVKNRVSKVHAELYVIVEPYEILVQRDKERERTVGAEVIRKMMTKFQVPDLYKENWDDIHIVSTSFHSIEHYVWLMRKSNFDQKNPHHTMDLYEHCFHTCDNMAKYLGKKERPDLLSAAFLHDWGKRYTQVIGEDGIAHYPGHANVSAYYCLMCTDCWDENKNAKKFLGVALLVEKHMIFFNKNVNWKRFTEIYGEEFVSKLEMLHKADVEAH